MNKENNIKWAILCTGWGRNAKDIIDVHTKNTTTTSTIQLVVYENEPCGAAEAARANNIETLLVKRADFDSATTYQKHLIKEILKRGIDYIFLLNYKYLVRADMLAAFPNRIINIHPSLFPSFLATKTAIQDALAYGVKITGITTHIIDEHYDRGTILCQIPIKVKKEDTFETLYPKFASKGLKIIEKTIRLIEKEHIN